jgi:hypothetical protein
MAALEASIASAKSQGGTAKSANGGDKKPAPKKKPAARASSAKKKPAAAKKPAAKKS